ncbi:MAG: hypothetical protein JM58_11545 [Peptococcaceae bacterium BICA1-8]|nr:MAG: hypothetical protein JM58_11545 [Peptococcaceae bacterium BICA1-8]
MIWAALLLSISSYSWYLIFAFNSSASSPDFWIGLMGLVFLVIIPTLLGLTINRNILASNPMVIRIILVNLLQYLLYTGLVTLGSIIINNYLLGISRELLNWTAFILPFVWQLMSWLFGTYYALSSAVVAAYRPSNIKAVEISLILIIPAVFILTFKGFPVTLLLMIIVCWFLTLTLTLAVEGKDTSRASVFRYELVFLHALIPTLAAIIFFIIAFYGELRYLLVAAQERILTLWNLFVMFLDWLFSEPAEISTNDYNFPAFNIRPEREVMAQELPSWFIISLLILAIPLFIALIRALIRLFKMRLGSQQTSPRKGYSFTRSLRQMWTYFFLLLGDLLKESLKIYILFKVIVGKFLKKIRQMLRRWLPAKTPYHMVFRSYEAFLGWGRKSCFSRKPGETPLEYVNRLEKSAKIQPFPSEEISQLTSIFLEAHYSNKPVSWQQGEKSKVLLKKIRLS